MQYDFGHSVSIQQIFQNFQAWPRQNLMIFSENDSQISTRKHAKFQTDICTRRSVFNEIAQMAK